jgi:hypothetical protein
LAAGGVEIGHGRHDTLGMFMPVEGCAEAAAYYGEPYFLRAGLGGKRSSGEAVEKGASCGHRTSVSQYGATNPDSQ